MTLWPLHDLWPQLCINDHQYSYTRRSPLPTSLLEDFTKKEVPKPKPKRYICHACNIGYMTLFIYMYIGLRTHPYQTKINLKVTYCPPAPLYKSVAQLGSQGPIPTRWGVVRIRPKYKFSYTFYITSVRTHVGYSNIDFFIFFNFFYHLCISEQVWERKNNWLRDAKYTNLE